MEDKHFLRCADIDTTNFRIKEELHLTARATSPPSSLYLTLCTSYKLVIALRTKLLAHIPNKKELHLTAHDPTPVGANELPVYPSKSSM